MKLIHSILFFVQSLTLFGQEQAPPLLQTVSSWSREIFVFPINFAPGITYEGKEEAVFPPNWAKKDSSEFWSYAFAWDINLPDKITKSKLETDLRLYFDGLMQSVHGKPEIKLPETQAVFSLKNDPNGIVTYNGKVIIFDAFFTKKSLTLNASVEQHLCKKQQKSVLIFRFSPKGFEDDLWEELQKIKLKNSFCEP